MPNNPLNIITVPSSDETSSSNTSSNRSRTARVKEMQAKFERMWLINPEQFNPLRNCMERERIERTWELLVRHTSLEEKQTADIGCGEGLLSRRLRDAGAHVEAVDIAENALKHLKEKDHHRIHTKQEALPNTSLPDNAYDVIVCTEVIADLNRDDYRLFFAELSRLVKSSGVVVCSSAIDIDSDGGVDKLNELAQTEFDILESVKSYHALYIRLRRMLEAPSRFIEGWQDSAVKKKELSKRHGFSWVWYWMNTSPLFVWMWYGLEPLTRPFRRLLKNSRKTLLRLEKFCRLLWDESGVSHYLFIAKRRPLQMVDPREIPIEHPHKKEIWE